MDFDFSTETITPDNSGTITLAGDFEITKHLQPSLNGRASAAGNTQGTALEVTSTTTIITSSVVGSAQGVRLPGLTTTISGTLITIVNVSANSIYVYPPTGGVIDGAAANAPITMPASTTVQLVASGGNGLEWVSINKAFVAGTNITLTPGTGTTTIASTGGGASLVVKEEGTNITTAASSLNFVGSSITASAVGSDVTVTVAGGGGGAPTDAQYLTLSSNVSLPNARQLTPLSDFTTIDLGADNDLTIALRKGGDSWVTGGSLPTAVSSWFSMAYGDGKFVHTCAGSLNTNGAISYDGVNWTATTMPSSSQWAGLAYGNGRFVSVQALSGQSSAVSYNGVNWTLYSNVLPSTASWNSVTFGNGVFITAAYGTTSGAFSFDGQVWQAVTLPASASWACGAYGDGTFVLFGAASTTAITSTNNGMTWTVRTLPSSTSWERAAYGNGTFVVITSSTSSAYAYSTNAGVTWNAGTLPAVLSWSGITFGNGVFIAVASGNQCAVSADGINWTMKSMPSSTTWKSICYGMGKFVTTDAEVTATSATSDVGISRGTESRTYGISYNDNGRWNAASNVFMNGGNLTIGESTPITPTTGTTIFGKRIASRVMPAAVGPSGMDYTFQPAIWRQKVARWNPPGGTATVPVVDGITAFTALGTATSRSVATTNVLTRMKRMAYLSAATAAALGGIYHTLAQYTTGNGAGLGGFFCAWRFAATDAATVSGARMFVGMSSSVAAATNVEPSTLTNSIGVAQLSTSSTQLYIVYGGSAAQTAIPLGTNFPPMTAAGATNGVAYELSIFASPNSNGVIGWRVERIGTQYVAEGVITPAVVGTQTPASSTLLAPRAWRCNNATAAAVGIDIITLYLETDY